MCLLVLKNDWNFCCLDRGQQSQQIETFLTVGFFMLQFKSSQSGASLMEMVVVIGVMGVVAFTFAKMFDQHNRSVLNT
jgi:hypothetical protein